MFEILSEQSLSDMMTKLSSTITMMVVAVLVLLGTPSAQGRTVTVTTPTTAATATSCPSPMCLLDKGCRPFTGPDGCLNCPCPDYNCDDVTCGPSQECVMKDVECPPDTTPCFPQPTCMPSNVTSTISTTTLTTTPSCPDLMCGPFCEQSPELYYGCPVCGCSYSTCEDVCGSDDACVMEPVACGNSDMHCVFWTCITTTVTSTISTTTLTTIPPCPDLMCGPFCEQSLELYGGCPVCGCSYSTCEDACSPGDECVMEFVVCGYNDMHCLFPRCIPTTGTTTISTTTTLTTTVPCAIPLCIEDCLPAMGPDGCLICACPDYTCQNVTCNADQLCVMQDVECPPDTTLCFRQPTCIQTYDSCTGTPNKKRCSRPKTRWFYNSSANACQKFRYYGCTPSPNTFLSLEACEDNCTRWDSPICPAIACAQGCYKLNRKNKCSKCICPDPCKSVKCGAGKECKLREVNCFEEHCLTEPFCAANSCPEQPPCGIRCLNDLKTDENGCQLCECAV